MTPDLDPAWEAIYREIYKHQHKMDEPYPLPRTLFLQMHEERVKMQATIQLAHRDNQRLQAEMNEMRKVK